MLLLVDKLSKLYSKLENHHHHHNHHHNHHDHHREEEEEALLASLQSFRSEISNSLNQLLLNSKPRSGILCFPWIQQCFELLPIINQAFAKFVVDINHPMNKWELTSLDLYLNYTLHLLDLLNSITSSLSHLGQARVTLSHALSLLENSSSLAAIQRLKEIEPNMTTGSSIKDFKKDEVKEVQERFTSMKEKVIHEAMLEVKSTCFWVCGVLMATLCGDVKPYLEIKQMSGGFSGSLLVGLDTSGCDVMIMEKGVLLEEVKELNDAVNCLLTAMASDKQSGGEAEELRRRLAVFEGMLEKLGKEVDHLFSKILTGRTKIIDTIGLGVKTCI